MSLDVAPEPVTDDARRTADRAAADRAVADLVAAAVGGDRVASHRLGTAVRSAVLPYCRGRLGDGAAAIDAAHRICRTFEATVADLAASGDGLRAFVHRIAVVAVDAVPVPADPPGMAGMLALLSPVQREVLVLRVAVGLSTEETAETLGCTAAQVRGLQHAALGRLRTAR